MNIFKHFKIAALIALAGFIFTACERKGPAEEVGEAIDDAVEDIGDAFD